MSAERLGIPTDPAPTDLRTGTDAGWSDDPTSEQDIFTPQEEK